MKEGSQKFCLHQHALSLNIKHIIMYAYIITKIVKHCKIKPWPGNEKSQL